MSKAPGNVATRFCVLRSERHALENLWDKRLQEGRDLKAEIQDRERRDRPRDRGRDLER